MFLFFFSFGGGVYLPVGSSVRPLVVRAYLRLSNAEKGKLGGRRG